MQEFAEAIRDMARINTRDNPKLNRLIPPRGEPPGRSWDGYQRPPLKPPEGGPPEGSPCNPPACDPGVSPMAKSIGGTSGAIDVIKGGKK
jgi:hypothetical protein